MPANATGGGGSDAVDRRAVGKYNTVYLSIFLASPSCPEQVDSCISEQSLSEGPKVTKSSQKVASLKTL